MTTARREAGNNAVGAASLASDAPQMGMEFGGDEAGRDPQPLGEGGARVLGIHSGSCARTRGGPVATNCSRLRALLSDGAWHSMRELQEVAGWRYGGRLHELKHGKDGGPPMDHETRREKSGEVFYRVTR